MSVTREIEAPSLEAAIERAVRETGAARESLKVQLLREERGWLGAAPKSVTIRVEFEEAGAPRVASRPAAARVSSAAPPSRHARPAPHVPQAEAEEAEPAARGDEEEGAAEPAIPEGPEPTYPQVEELARDLVSRLGLDLSAELSEQPDRIVLNLHGEDRELLLGDRAEPLNAIQYLLGRMVRKRFGTAKRLQVESDGFRSSREDELRAMAAEAAERARSSGEIVWLPALNPYERRIVHVAINGMTGISTESEGDGFLKRVMVKPAGARRPQGGGRRGQRPGGGGRGRGFRRG